MTTLAVFRENVSAIIGLANNSAEDQPLIDRWVNEGYEAVLRETRGRVRSATFTPGANADVVMDTAVMFIVDAFIITSNLSTPYRMEKVALEDLLAMRLNGGDVAANPPRYYAFQASDLMCFYPEPSDTDVCVVYYVPRATALSLSTAEPSDVPAEWQHLIEFYALFRAADYDDDTSSDQGQRYYKMFADGIKEMRRDLNFKGRHRLNRSRIPGAGMRTRPHVNSRDTGV